MLNRSGNNGLPCLVSHLEGNAFHILTLTVASAVGFLYMPVTDSVMCLWGPSYLNWSNSSSSWRYYWQTALDCQPSSAKKSQPGHITSTSWGSSPRVAGWHKVQRPTYHPKSNQLQRATLISALSLGLGEAFPESILQPDFSLLCPVLLPAFSSKDPNLGNTP